MQNRANPCLCLVPCAVISRRLFRKSETSGKGGLIGDDPWSTERSATLLAHYNIAAVENDITE